MVSVLFVCMGNICRSPTAEGVFRAIVEREGLAAHIRVDSAGTHAYHIGNPPDNRSQAAARNRGVDLSRQRARRALPDDFRKFDYVLAMDRDNHADLASLCPSDQDHKLGLFLDFTDDYPDRDVPDPYYGGQAGFELVLDMVDAAARGLLDHIRRTHL